MTITHAFESLPILFSLSNGHCRSFKNNVNNNMSKIQRNDLRNRYTPHVETNSMRVFTEMHTKLHFIYSINSFVVDIIGCTL